MKKALSLSAIFLIVAIVVFGLIGCGSKTKPAAIPLQFSVKLTIEDKNPKTVTVDADSTALTAIQKAYSYSKGNSSTTINGATNSWSYTVDGKMPIDPNGRLDSQGKPLYLGITEYYITKDCTIDLQRLIKP